MPDSQANETFRHNVRALLEERGWSIQDLADRLGVARPNVSRILAGKEGVTLDRAEKIARCFGFPLAAMLAEKFAQPVG